MNATAFTGLIIILILSIPCNTFAITFIYKTKEKRTVKDRVITTFCVSNLWQTIGYIIELHFAVNRQITTGVCEAAAFILCFCTYTTIGCFMTLTIERYLSILYPFFYRIVFERKGVSLLSVLIPTLYGFVFAVAPLFGWGRYGPSRINSTYCAFDFKNKTLLDESFFLTVINLAFVLPICVTAICFGRILCELKRATFVARRQFGNKSMIARDSNKSVYDQSITSLLTVLIYVISWAPYAIVCFLFYNNKVVSFSLEYFAIFMAKSSTVTSPFVFCIIEKRVRRNIQQMTWKNVFVPMVPLKHSESQPVSQCHYFSSANSRDSPGTDCI